MAGVIDICILNGQFADNPCVWWGEEDGTWQVAKIVGEVNFDAACLKDVLYFIVTRERGIDDLQKMPADFTRGSTL
jgi:hypothetical protein